jgi:hypothetical protein
MPTFTRWMVGVLVEAEADADDAELTTCALVRAGRRALIASSKPRIMFIGKEYNSRCGDILLQQRGWTMDDGEGERATRSEAGMSQH